MKIIDLLKKDAIELNTSVASKSDAIDKLVALHEKAGNLVDVNAYKMQYLQEKLRAQLLSVRELQFRMLKVKV